LKLDEVKTIEATEDEVTELRLLPGDILLNEGGDRDKLGRGWVWHGELAECIHQNHVFRARPVNASVEPKYVSHYANLFGQSFFIDQGKQTTNLASVSLSRVRRFPVALPPAAEQSKVIALLEDRLGQVSSISSSAAGVGGALSVLERTMLAKAFRGELVPQDPSDEPAEATLERLRGTNGAAANKGGKTKSPKRTTRVSRAARDEA
jgi:type I restriction enzyme S subunit